MKVAAGRNNAQGVEVVRFEVLFLPAPAIKRGKEIVALPKPTLLEKHFPILHGKSLHIPYG